MSDDTSDADKQPDNNGATAPGEDEAPNNEAPINEAQENGTQENGTQENEAAPAGPDAADQGEQAPRQAPYRIDSQYLKDLSFESPRVPEVFQNAKHLSGQIDVSIDVATKTIAPRHVEVSLLIEAKCETDEGVVYVLEATYACIVVIGPVPKEALPPLLLIEVPRLIFPFARTIVADTTRDGGFNTLFLAPYDFLGLFEAKMKQHAEAAAAAEQNAGGEQDTETA